jgi:hypothetical protein
VTLVRKLALRISETVARYASPGWKDWAEGLSRETAVIENDWSALSWALGSARVLLDRREAPLRSLGNISSVTWSYVEAKRNTGTAIWLFLFIFSFQTAVRYFTARGSAEHIGCGLVVFGMLCLGICVLIEQHRLDALRKTDTRDAVLIYKAELERSRDLPWTPRGWLIFTGLLVLFIGSLLGQRGGVTADLPFSALLVLNFLAVAWAILRNLRRLEQLEALLAEQS